MISSRQSNEDNDETEKVGRLVLVMTGLVLFLLVFVSMVAPPGSLKPVTPPVLMTAEQAAAALRGIGRDESCIQGTAANGQTLHVKKVSPMARELYDQGRFRLDGVSSARSDEQFFNDPQHAIEVMGNRGVIEFRQCSPAGR
jgi:hypothetical protein